MIAQVRTARPAIILNGKDFYAALAPYLISMTYTDNCDGKKADDLSIELADRDKRFISDWMPDKGETVEAQIIAERWFTPMGSALKLDCGKFWIDSVEFTLPDQTVSIKASSIPTDAHIKGSDETRGWENTTLQKVAQQIAGENKMTVRWDASFDPRYSRIEQVEESGLAFLKGRAKDAKLAIKLARGEIIFFDEKEYEAKEPTITLLYGDMSAGGGGIGNLFRAGGFGGLGGFTGGGQTYRMAGAHFVTQLTDKTKKAAVSHTSLATGKMSKQFAESSDPDLESSWVQNIAEGTDSADEDEEGEENGNGQIRAEGDPNLIGSWERSGDSAAGRRAESEVREKNKDKEKSKIELAIGNPLIASGMTVNVKGCGLYDGKYFIESAHHVCGPAYKTEIIVRKCLTDV